MRRDIELFEELDDNEISALEAIASEKTYHRGNILFFEGEKPQKLHLLLDGIVKVYKVDARGNEVILHFFRPQTLIAETAHMQRIPFPATAVCETESTLLEIDYAEFEKRFLRNPDIGMKLIYSLSNKVKNLQEVINTNLTMDSLSRICHFLCENEAHLPEISQRKIAAILNITPETLSRNITRLKNEHILSVEKRTIVIHDKKALRRYC